MPRAATQENEPQTRVDIAPGTIQPSLSSLHFVLGIIFLLSSVVATLLLVLEHLGGLALPGCGPGSACAQAAASIWGKVPGLNWPVSFLGFSFFLAMLVGWIVSRSGVSAGLRYCARAGVFVSLFYIVVIAIGKYGCKYCLAAHAGNFAFWIVCESARTSIVRTLRPAPVIAAFFAVSLAVLGITETRQKAAVEKKGKEELADSTKRIIDVSSQSPTNKTQTISPTTSAPANDANAPPWQGCFTGRHRMGPEEAPIRIVIFSDYQCPDCYRTESELEPVLAQRKDISFSFRYYAMCNQCNPNIKGEWCPHPNACWAARAAETAFMLHGEEGFWQMHRWLFARKGSFTPEELREAINGFNYNYDQFSQILTSQETLARVQEDIRFGTWLGLHYTPMVFINGVELKGILTKNAIPTAVEKLTAAKPPARTCESDHPVPAGEKYIQDWLEQNSYSLKRITDSWPFGPDNAPMKVVVWGDYQEPNTRRVDGIIRRFMEGKTDVQYVWRHFPADQSCNPHTSVTPYPWGCKASSAALAAGMVGGSAAFAKMHDWLFKNQRDFTDDDVRKAAESFGVPGDLFLARMNGPEVKQSILEDAGAGKALDLRQVPTIFINGRPVPRWSRGEESLLESMLQIGYEKKG